MGEREAGDWLEQADFFILGVLSLLAAFFLACWLRFGDLAVLGSPLYRNLTAVLAVVELLVSAAFGEPGRESKGFSQLGLSSFARQKSL